MIRLASISVAVAALLTAWSPSFAAGTAGDTVNVSYYFPDKTNLYNNAGDFVVPSSGIDTIGSAQELVSLSANSIVYSFTVDSTFTVSDFNGVVFTDLSGPHITSVSIDPSSNLMGLTAADLTFTSTTISLNTQGLSFTQDTVVQLDINSGGMSTVPLPASAPMFGAALLALGIAGFAAKRGQTAA